MQDDDIPGIVRYHTYEVLKEEVNNPKLRWAYLPYSMHMAGPREAIQHMIIRKNYGTQSARCDCIPRWKPLNVSLISLHCRKRPHMGSCRSEPEVRLAHIAPCAPLSMRYGCRVHTFHHWPGYGRLQEHTDRGGLLWSL